MADDPASSDATPQVPREQQEEDDDELFATGAAATGTAAASAEDDGRGDDDEADALPEQSEFEALKQVRRTALVPLRLPR